MHIVERLAHFLPGATTPRPLSKERRGPSSLILLAPYAVVLLALALAALASRLWGIPVSVFTRDPVTSLGGVFYTGWLSSLGAVIWWGTAAICLFAAAVVSSRSPEGAERRTAKFLLASGLLSALLGADDLFMLHDGLFAYVFHIGERYILAGYFLLLIAYLYTFRRSLAGPHALPLAAAFFFLGGSLVVDLGFIVVQESNRHLVEDGLKLLGIAGWFSCFASASFRACVSVRPQLREGSILRSDIPHSDGPTNDPAPSVARFELPSSRVAGRWMWTILALLMVAHLAGQSIRFGLLHGQRNPLIDRFDLDVESNFPSWYSAGLWLVAGILAAGIRSNARGRYARHWMWLAALFTFLSLDEATQIHEKLIPPMRRLLGSEGIFYYPWIAPAALFVAVVGMLCRPLLTTLPSAIRQGLVISGAVYVAGALGFEALGGWWASGHGVENMTMSLFVAVEEGLEIVGLTLLVCCLLRHARGEQENDILSRTPGPA